MPGETQRMAMPRIESTSRRDQVDEDLEEMKVQSGWVPQIQWSSTRYAETKQTE
jgi:hypothetical protein